MESYHKANKKYAQSECLSKGKNLGWFAKKLNVIEIGSMRIPKKAKTEYFKKEIKKL